MIHGDTSVAFPSVTMPLQVDRAVVEQRPEPFPISRFGYAVHTCALAFYEAVMTSTLEITPQSVAEWTDPLVGQAVLALLDACHDLVERQLT